MSETNNTGDKTQGAEGRKTLSLKRGVETGQVRQSFSHGRTKAVVVEKKRKRIVPGEAPAKTVEPQPRVSEPKVAKPAPRGEASRPAPKPSGGMVLPTLTEQEREARAKALQSARSAEEEARRRAAEEAKRRAAEEERQRREREEAEARRRDEETRRAAEEESKRKAAEDADRRTEQAAQPSTPEPAQEAPAPAAKPVARAPLPPRARTAAEEEEELRRGRGKAVVKSATPAVRKADGKGRPRKLTLANAFESDDERVRSLASFRRQRERERRAHRELLESRQKITREVVLPDAITVQELANRMAERGADVVKELMKLGIMATINQTIDADTAEVVIGQFGHAVKRVSEADVEIGFKSPDDKAEDTKPRPPIVTVMGHVDHGKTSLLDALRSTDVVSGEAGGITQHIGAYQVRLESGDRITFIDTPGHAAFTAMRARGAKVTDIVVLVVAADDGVMPQTIEAISHAKAANVPIIVAINKIDKPGADPNRVRTELLSHEIVVESMGGDTLEVEVSALKRMNLDKLIDAIILQSEVLELKANPDRDAEGVVIEAQLDKGRGAVGTMLVQRGTLRVGDIVVAGAHWGKVRAMENERGERVDEAGPSVPVAILGLSGAPDAGDEFAVVENESRAREIVDYRQRKLRETQAAPVIRSLDQMMSQLKEGERKEVPIVLKADVQGSVEAIQGALEKMSTDEVAVRVLHGGVGGITESDVTLAEASNAVVIGFNVRANKQARDLAERNKTEIRYYSVIYDLVDDLKAALEGLLEPELRETFLGNAEILEVFNITKVGKVAGCRMTEGVARRDAKVRLIRDNVVIHEGTLSTLKRFKDEVKEVHAGQECGMAFQNYQDIQPGDVIEIFDVQKIKRTL
ncbi:translation initiation factor IF-2 [Futiania mangrovi]|uniref:Translation initiation factor IF-2 n=1 Tax=Futiania mangrovi TaxID=2959716 RepID=A0A9J6PB81_9PROT|nr:translation initiation factor IF-2 [Futiania mangrovii]MCP1336429.1 translation initiation factor IF-2 [Futiania mangrovii]